MLSSKVPLGSTAPFEWPSASLEFLHSLSLPLPVLSKTQLQRAFSCLMLALSHSDTRHLNRHMASCGCHEILIEPCITVLFLSNFSPYPIQRRFWWVSCSNHSFQLIIVFSTVSVSLTGRNHPFRLPIEGRLTFGDISSFGIRTKQVNWLQSTVHRILTHWRNRKRSLFWKDPKIIVLTIENT